MDVSHFERDLEDLYTQNPGRLLSLVRQLNAIRVSPFPFVFLGKNLFKPVCLSLRRFLVNDCGVLKQDELLAAVVTPKRAHFLETGCSLFGLPFPDRHCFH